MLVVRSDVHHRTESNMKHEEKEHADQKSQNDLWRASHGVGTSNTGSRLQLARSNHARVLVRRRDGECDVVPIGGLVHLLQDLGQRRIHVIAQSNVQKSGVLVNGDDALQGRVLGDHLDIEIASQILSNRILRRHVNRGFVGDTEETRERLHKSGNAISGAVCVGDGELRLSARGGFDEAAHLAGTNLLRQLRSGHSIDGEDNSQFWFLLELEVGCGVFNCDIVRNNGG
mmetsp:Transcript_48913/g.72691  ORF Transcript_48913/g.72691 Transcript_48913/m.72691 type:complete len:229 (-) Transcript_48913:162-848(-)